MMCKYEKVTIDNDELKNTIKIMGQLELSVTFHNMVLSGFFLNNFEKMKYGKRIGK